MGHKAASDIWKSLIWNVEDPGGRIDSLSERNGQITRISRTDAEGQRPELQRRRQSDNVASAAMLFLKRLV
jgi:hypothetical protein